MTLWLHLGTYARFSDDELRKIAADANRFGLPLPAEWFRRGPNTFIKAPNGRGAWVTSDELAALEANGMQWPPKPGSPPTPTHTTQTNAAPRAARAATKTEELQVANNQFSEAANLLRKAAASSPNPKQRASAQRALTLLYASPFGDIDEKDKKNSKRSASDEDEGDSLKKLIQQLKRMAADPDNPDREKAKEVLKTLEPAGDEESDDSDDNAGAKAMSGNPDRSGHGEMLDRAMGLASHQRTEVRDTKLILRPVGFKR